MEEEISLKEIISTLWKGRYLIISITAAAMIIAFVVSYFFTVPMFKTTAAFDFGLIDYSFDHERIIEETEQEQVIETALQDLTGDPVNLARTVSFDQDNDKITVTVEARDPELAAQAAQRVSLLLPDAVEEKMRSEIAFLDHRLEYFNEHFPGDYAKYFNEADLSALKDDPGYIYMIEEEKGQRLAMMHNLKFWLAEFEDIITDDDFFHAPATPTEPHNIRWPLNTAVAGVLGLMLSVFIVFIRPHVGELLAELKDKDSKD